MGRRFRTRGFLRAQEKERVFARTLRIRKEGVRHSVVARLSRCLFVALPYPERLLRTALINSIKLSMSFSAT